MKLTDELAKAHSALREQFDTHRDLIVGLEFQKALEKLEGFEKELKNHIKMEEELILPIYEERIVPPEGGDPKFFYLEHQNILKILSTIKDSLREIIAGANFSLRRAHKFLREEDLFLHLIEHHNLREENILYPLTIEVMTKKEHENLWVKSHTLRMNKDVNMKKIFYFSLILIAFGVVGTFPPFFELFHH